MTDPRPTYLAALFTMLQTVYTGVVDAMGEPVLVTYGPAGSNLPGTIVMLGDQRSTITRPTLGTGRSRDTRFEVDVEFNCYLQGGPEIQQTVTEQCWNLLPVLENYFRVAGQERIGGTYDTHLGDVGELQQLIAYSSLDDPTAEPIPVGRQAILTVPIQANIRY